MPEPKLIRVVTYTLEHTKVPLAYKPLLVVGDNYRLGDCDLVDVNRNGPSKQIDWNDRADRKWLESHSHWAMMNNLAVALIPESN